jgi:hypothetical protein
VSRATLPGIPADRRDDRDGAPRWTRVLVVYEAVPSGAVALNAAARLVGRGARLAVVTLAPQARPIKCCGGGGPGPYNCAVRDVAEEELREARTVLGEAARQATFATLSGTPEPPLAAFVAEHEFDLILLPAHRLSFRGGRLARRLRRCTQAEIRTVR